MDSEAKFLETLKKLGFPHVNQYSTSDFESYFSDPDLRPFLEYFCTLDENNVLTSEELEEYASIPPDEMKKLKELASCESEYLKEEKDIEKKEEVEFLTEQLNQLERKYSSMEEQKRILLEQEAVILKEKMDCEATNKSLRKLFDDFSLNKVPQGIAQLSATLESISELISTLKNSCDLKDDEMLPFLNLGDIKDYFKEEEKLSHSVLNSLLHDFKFEDKTKINIPGLTKEEISKEINILRNSLKVSKLCESKSVCDEMKGEKIALLLNKYQAGYFDDVLQMSVTQLSNKFAEANKLNEYLNKKEAVLLSRLTDAIGEHVDEQCRQIALAHSNEIRLIYENSLESISSPLQYLLSQRARLELLNLLINVHQRHWQEIKALLEQLSRFADSEKESCLCRQQKIEESMKLAEEEETHLKPDSIFFSAHKVLSGDIENPEQTSITLSQVIQSIEKLTERKEFISKITEENSKVIETLEKQYSDVEKMISRGTEFDGLMTAEKNFSTKSNQVEAQWKEICSTFKKFESDWHQKNKLLESKRNLKLARSLFIYALLEREVFEKIIENIEGARPHLL